MASNTPNPSDDNPKIFKSKTTIGKVAESIIHPQRTISRAKDVKVEKRREVLRANIGSPFPQPELEYDPNVQPPGIYGHLANEYSNHSGIPPTMFKVPVAQGEIPKLRERTSLGMVAPEGQRYQCTECKKEIGVEFRGACVVGKYMCGSCRTKVQQGFIEGSRQAEE
ncbi:hypothetical protein K440DRAFT_640169 [Wilcoxina mikolae CBS 423.85]|nr:hypothetical protein K440DRAFT_640169 [Wilcoxina mikolae CBS 423.85]